VRRLIHLNGPPGIGKSTLARAYVEQAHGTLNADIDVLRTMVGGWTDDFLRSGILIRPAATALVSAYLGESGDVVFPQMLADPREVERYAQAAAQAGAAYVELMLLPEPESDVVARFHRRGEGGSQEWHDQVRTIVAAQGGDASLRRTHERLLELLELRPQVRVVTSREGDPADTLAAVLAILNP